MRTLLFAAICGAIAWCTAGSAAAGEPRFGQTAFTVADGSVAQLVFKPDTPKITLHAELLDVAKGTTLIASWIAEKTEVAPPNYKIDSAAVTSGIGADATFSLSKPDNGWPAGDYRVELSINGVPAKSAKFQIAP